MTTPGDWTPTRSAVPLRRSMLLLGGLAGAAGRAEDRAGGRDEDAHPAPAPPSRPRRDVPLLSAGVAAPALRRWRWMDRPTSHFSPDRRARPGSRGYGIPMRRAGEWDPHCTRVLERWWPDVPRWGDVTTFPEHVGPEGRAPSGTSAARGPGGRGRVGEPARAGGGPAAADTDGGRLEGLGAPAAGAVGGLARRDDAVGLGDLAVGAAAAADAVASGGRTSSSTLGT